MQQCLQKLSVKNSKKTKNFLKMPKFQKLYFWSKTSKNDKLTSQVKGN